MVTIVVIMVVRCSDCRDYGGVVLGRGGGPSPSSISPHRPLSPTLRQMAARQTHFQIPTGTNTPQHEI